MSGSFEGVKWEKSNKIHITLKFLGSVSEETANETGRVLNPIIKGFCPITLEYLQLDAFPDFKRPRVIVLKLARNGQLEKLKQLIEFELFRIGIESDKREFLPHITIGRVKKGFKVIEPVSKFRGNKFTVENIALVESKLGKTGSEYVNLGVYKLS